MTKDEAFTKLEQLGALVAERAVSNKHSFELGYTRSWMASIIASSPELQRELELRIQLNK